MRLCKATQRYHASLLSHAWIMLMSHARTRQRKLALALQHLEQLQVPGSFAPFLDSVIVTQLRPEIFYTENPNPSNLSS